MTTFTIEEQFFNDEIVAFYLGAIDINTGSSNVLLFDYLVYSSDTENCYNSDKNLFLHLKISIYSPQLGFNEFEKFLKSTFKLSKISSAIHFKNTDMNFDTNSIPGAEMQRLEYTLGGNSEDTDVQTIVNLIMQSGKIPNGSYIFDAILTSDENGDDIIHQVSRQIDVYEPQYINIISPGGSLSDTLSTVVYNPYPVFNWESDNCTSSNCNIGIRVCEFDPNYHSNLSDAMESNSLLPINQSFDYFMLDSTATSFQYPILGAESLREGKYYVWQLKRSYETTVGEESLFSDIFVFKLHSFQGNAVNSSTNLEVIKGIVGEDQYRILFGSNGELSSFTSEIALVTLDGEEIPISQLYEILSKVEQSQINILEVKSE
ncbi:MAG: hypothetical protein HOG97_06800 [Candidatus Marinimicrobia bacterium]|nr:hypothetical protein [Candidatus Neomarinimicrobiota bacterium]